MSTERASAPLDADLEEDTQLPPPAPGLRSPVADHYFDPPTLPGIVAPHRRLPQSDRAVDREHNPPTHDLPAHMLAQRRSGHQSSELAQSSANSASSALWADPTGADSAAEWEDLPQRSAKGESPAALPAEETLRMHVLPQLSPPVPAPPPESGAPDALPPPPLSGRTPTAAPDDSYRTAQNESRSLASQTTQTLPAQIAQLPPLPPTPEHDSLLAGLRYSRAVFRSLRKRRRLQEQLQVSQRADLDSLDRALVRLGQRAYTDHLDLLDWHPLFAGDVPKEPAESDRSPEALLQKRAERAAARLQAQGQTTAAACHKREAQLESELRQCGQRLQKRQADLFALDQRTRGVPVFHPLYHQRHEAEIAVTQSFGEVDELAQSLGLARAQRLLHERIYSHAQPPADQLAVALSPKLAAAQRRTPHLLVLGALLATAGIGIEPPGTKAAGYTGLWQRLLQLQTTLALRQTLLARLELDRLTYDRNSIHRTMLTLGILTAALLASAALILLIVKTR